MRYRKCKWLSLVTALLIVLVSAGTVCAQEAEVIYRESKIQPVAPPGVTYERLGSSPPRPDGYDFMLSGPILLTLTFAATYY